MGTGVEITTLTLSSGIPIYTSGGWKGYVPYVYTSGGWEKAAIYVATGSGWAKASYSG